MAKNFNVNPYYDDFSASKNFHRILFKPGYAVQARELTQSQSILQDQITKFADHVFKQNTPVSGGNVTTNLNCNFIKLQQTYAGTQVDVNQFIDKLITDGTGLIVAKVIAVAESTGDVDLDGNNLGDPPTLIVSYRSGEHFSNNDTIFDTSSNLAALSALEDAVGSSSVCSIDTGVFYVEGNFVQVNPQTTILSKYSNSPTLRVGLFIDENIVDYVDDSSLLDPALGASNYQAPGADRYQITLTLTTRPLQLGDDDGFIELLRINEGYATRMVDGTVYSVIDDYFAKRTYETNGDYVVSNFKLTPKIDENDDDKYIMSVGSGTAYVRGYRIENPREIEISTNRSRTTDTLNDVAVYTDYGSYFTVNSVKANTSSFFDTTRSDTIDLHCVNKANVNVATSNAYSSTLVGTAYIRGLSFDSDNGSANTENWTYKMYVHDIQTNSIVGYSSGSSGTSNVHVRSDYNVYFTNANNAYVGATIKLTQGTNAGESRIITSYTTGPSSRVFTVDRNWSVAPSSDTKFSLILATKDIESILKVDKNSYPASIKSSSQISNDGKRGGIASGDTIFDNPLTPELIFPLGYPYVSEVLDTSYTTTQQHRSKVFSGSSPTTTTISLSDYSGTFRHIGQVNSFLSYDAIKENFIIAVTDKGLNSQINVGDIINLEECNGRIEISSTGYVATISIDDYSSFTADIIVKTLVSNADSTNYVLKSKYLINANTSKVVTTGTQVNTHTYVDDSVLSSGQIYIKNAGIVSYNQKQSLYLSDVKNIVKIIDTKNSSVIPTVEMLSDNSYDITRNYNFDNGQRDNYYDHATISLKPGASKPSGNILVLVNYYKHSGGDGYFSKMSYIDISTSPENYREIPSYTSTYGAVYKLSDCLDFRPARLNAQSSFVYNYSNTGDTVRYGYFLPLDLSLFYCGSYSYYLARKDKVIINKDKELSIIEGVPAINPIFPTESEGSLVLAKLTHSPYTGYLPTELSLGVSSLSVELIQHKRYTMQDISELDGRINRIEYYTSLNTLEQSATGIQIKDANGLNRFKNGILVDDFSSFETSDSGNSDFTCNLNRRIRQLSAIQGVNNYSLTNLLMAYNMNQPSTAVKNSLSYSIRKAGSINNYLLPYTTTELTKQRIASRIVNLNPFAVSTSTGVLALSPNVDNWVDTNYNPSILITAPGLQIFQNTLIEDIPFNLISSGDWQTISSTKTLEDRKREIDVDVDTTRISGGRTQTTTTTTTTTTSVYNNIIKEQRNFLYGPYSSIQNTYSMDTGFITDISILPYIRKQEITLSVNQMLINTKVFMFFDNIPVERYIKNPNILELTNCSGTFGTGDIIGYKPTSSTFVPTARVVGTYKYPNSANVRLYIVGDSSKSNHNLGPDDLIHNATFNSNNQYATGSGHGTFNSYLHNSGTILGYGNNLITAIYPPPEITSNTITLSASASSSNTSYVGNTLFINAGTGAGQYSVISAYNGSTKVVTLANKLRYRQGDIYTIGVASYGNSQFKTNESGDLFGVFYIPENTFQTGQKTFRIDNRINNNIATTTTYAEGVFFASGLQTEKTKLDFGAAPSNQTISENRERSYKTTEVDTTTTTSTSISGGTLPRLRQRPPSQNRDPVAQTFIIDSVSYPNGVFLSSVKLFFKSKATQNVPVTLTIVGTLNGYPNGEIVPNSYVIKNTNDIKISETPHELDSNTYTEFEFDVPVFIQPEVLYAFVVKTISNEYEVWTALNSDIALPSSVKNLPTDPTPSVITKISAAPYVGALFLSQNSITWTADQNQSMMFVMNRCVFDTTKIPTIRFITPKGLPQRQIIDQTVDYFNDANTLFTQTTNASNTDILFDAFNVSTTDFIPSKTNINYTYSTTLQDGTSDSIYNVDPGKYGSTMYEHIYLNDGKGRRKLQSNTSTSFSLYATLASISDAVSPVISESGLTVYTIKNGINNCELSNNIINVIDGGSGYYNANTILVTISSPLKSDGIQAYASANVDTANGVIRSVTINNNGAGSGYITTPTVTISDANTIPGTGAQVTITGETSSSGGPAYTKYVTKKVVLDQGFDSGDINVYLTAYRPLNTDILVYYKILNRDDTQRFEDSTWQLMTKIKNTDTLYSYSRGELFEFVFAPGVYNSNQPQGYVSYESRNGQIYDEFNQFAIKIVLTTTDKTFCPYINDIRAIALLKDD